MADVPLKTPLHDWHAAHGGRMVDFAGWEMPVQYSSIVTEHLATRDVCGLFDISHMGRLRFDGPAAVQLLNGLLTRRVDNIPLGRIRYSLMTNDAGGVLDDVLIYRIVEPEGTDYCLLVVNAGNRRKIVDWITGHIAPLPVREELGEGHGTASSHVTPRPTAGLSPEGRGVGIGPLTMTDLTLETAMIAVQGPAALKIMSHLTDVKLAAMKYYSRDSSVAPDIPAKMASN